MAKPTYNKPLTALLVIDPLLASASIMSPPRSHSAP